MLPHTHSQCDSCPVRHSAVCDALSDAELGALSQINRRRKIASGQVILSDQDSSDFFANVLSGTVKLIKTMPDGRQQIVGLLFATDFLGRAFSFSNPYFAEAATDVELCCFPHDEFQRVIDEYPGLQHRLFENALDELDAAREWMLLLGRKTAEEKIASFLILLAKRARMAGCAHHVPPTIVTFELPLTRADIADYLGLTIETVSRQLTRLKSTGVIKMVSNRVFTVPQPDVLAEIAGVEDGEGF